MLKEGLEDSRAMPGVDEIVYGYDALGRRIVREEYRENSWWLYGSGEKQLTKEYEECRQRDIGAVSRIFLWRLCAESDKTTKTGHKMNKMLFLLIFIIWLLGYFYFVLRKNKLKGILFLIIVLIISSLLIILEYFSILNNKRELIIGIFILATLFVYYVIKTVKIKKDKNNLRPEKKSSETNKS